MPKSTPTPERNFPLRRTIADLPSSKIREVAALGMGKPGVIPLWFGEPDLPTPDFINRAASQALGYNRRAGKERRPDAHTPDAQIHSNAGT